MLEKEAPETPPDTPLLERSSAAVKVLIRTGKKRGYVTHDQINSLAKEVNFEQIEDILAMFNEMGINIVEFEEAETEEATDEAPEEIEEEESEGEVARTTPAGWSQHRTAYAIVRMSKSLLGSFNRSRKTLVRYLGGGA